MTIRAESRVVIQRPIEEVFAFLSDWANYARWEADVIETGQVSEGPMGVGTIVRDVRKSMGRRIETLSRVTHYEPHSKIAVQSTSGSMPFEWRATLTDWIYPQIAQMAQISDRCLCNLWMTTVLGLCEFHLMSLSVHDRWTSPNSPLTVTRSERHAQSIRNLCDLSIAARARPVDDP